MTLFAEVVFPLPLDQSFHYTIRPGDDARVAPGIRVRAPLGTKNAAGFVVSVSDRPPTGDFVLKEVREVLDAAPVLGPEALAFAGRLSAHHRSPLGELLQAMLPPSLEIKSTARIRITGAGEEALREKKLRGAEKAISELLAKGPSTPIGLKRRSGLKSAEAAIRRMAAKGWIEVFERSGPPKRRRPAAGPAPRTAAQLELDFDAAPESADFHSAVSAALGTATFASFYLQGPREARRSAWLKLIGEAVGRSRTVLALFPEVAAAEEFRTALETRLDRSAALIHGGTSEGRRETDWSLLRSGRISVAVGTRSALFAPLERPGLIIVEDEGDDSFFQSESPAFDARTGARFRAEAAGAVLVLGSDAPSVEAYAKASERGALYRLPARGDRAAARIVDDSRERDLLSRELLDALAAAGRSGRKAVLFLNRRGYASSLFCPRCGHVPRCPDCRTAYAYSKKDGTLSCRYCRTAQPAAPTCPECGHRVLEPRGAGVEAVEEEVRRKLPRVRTAVFDSDRIRTLAAREDVLDRFGRGAIDVLIGTQLLVHAEFPPVPLVGVLNPEALLGAADHRAAQRTYRMVRRMLDRTEADGAAIIQTALPDHPCLRAAARDDYGEFFEAEIRLRRAMGLPPFAAMAEIVFWGGAVRRLAGRARGFVERARSFRPPVEILGPAVTIVAASRGGRGIQVVVRAGEAGTIDACLEDCLRPVPGPRSVVRSD